MRDGRRLEGGAPSADTRVTPPLETFVVAQERPRSVKWLRAEVARSLAPLAAGLVAVLRRVISHSYPEQVVFIEFEVFADPSAFTEGFPVRAFFLDRNNTEYFEYVNGTAIYPANIDPGLLSTPGVISRETWNAWEQHDPEIDTYTMAAEAVIPWFSDCWKRAGGAAFRLPAFICLHDDCWTYDLRADGWCDARTGKRIASKWPPRGA